jgi:hypothetical protein
MKQTRGANDRTQPWQRIDQGLQFALKLYLVARVLASAWAGLAASLGPIHVPWEGHAAYETIHAALPHRGFLADLLLGVWYRWDTGWFMTIAIHGYGSMAETIVFAPLYPFVVRLLGKILGGQYLLAGVIISNAAYLGALYLLYRLVDSEFSEHVAKRSLLWFVVYPGAFFFLAAYTESLFLLLILLAFHGAQRRRWTLAAAGVLLATLTRWAGLALVLPVAWEALTDAGWTPWPVRLRDWLHQARRAWRGLLAAAAGPAAMVAYFAHLQIAGQSSPFDAYDSSWHSRFSWPLEYLAEAVRSTLMGQLFLADAIGLVMLVLFLGLTVVGFWRLRASWWLFALFSQLFFMLRIPEQRPLEGALRYLAVLFPCFVVLALVVRNRWLRASMTVFFVLLQALLLALFARWLWVA